MVLLHRLNGSPFFLNPELIKTIETTPDTTILLTNGDRYIVSDPAPDVIERILEYRRNVRLPAARPHLMGK